MVGPSSPKEAPCTPASTSHCAPLHTVTATWLPNSSGTSQRSETGTAVSWMLVHCTELAPAPGCSVTSSEAEAAPPAPGSMGPTSAPKWAPLMVSVVPLGSHSPPATCTHDTLASVGPR